MQASQTLPLLALRDIVIFPGMIAPIFVGREKSILALSAAQKVEGSIYSFTHSPDTVADGLRTLALSMRTFCYLQKLDQFLLTGEHEIYYWTAWLIHLLKVACEPSCALNMACVQDWLRNQQGSKKILVLLSGGNIDPMLYREIWKEDYLLTTPKR